MKTCFQICIAIFSLTLLFFQNNALSDGPRELIRPNETFSLSPEEVRFLQALPVLKVMIDEDFLPLSNYDTTTGAFQGVSVDLFVYIARKIGLKYRLIHDAKLNWSDKVKLFNARKIDLLFPTSYTEQRAEHGLFTTSYYTSYYCAIAKISRNIKIKKLHDLEKYTVGVTKSTSIIPFIKKFIPEEQITYYNNQYDLYEGVQNNKIDIGLRSRLVFHEERFNAELFNLDVIYTIEEDPRSYAYYFIKSADNARLVAIIDRYMAETDYSRLVEHYEKGVDELIVRYISQKQEQRKLWLTTAVIALILALVAVHLLYYRKLSKKLAIANGKLELLNRTDALTGLKSRRHFDEVLPREYARHSRSGLCLSVIMLDIDNFKLFNDTYGHVMGDYCLKQVASVIKSCATRASDLSARYGGEEFVCILPETDLQGAVSIGEKIRMGIRNLDIPHSTSTTVPWVTASLGVVTSKCQPGEPPMEIVAMADEALFRAKAHGRNRLEFINNAREDTTDEMH